MNLLPVYPEPIDLILLAAFLALFWGTFWAMFLQFVPLGQFLAAKRTWVTVIVGVGVVLVIALLVVPWPSWWPLAILFTAAGLPIVIRSLANEHREIQEELHELQN